MRALALSGLASALLHALPLLMVWRPPLDWHLSATVPIELKPPQRLLGRAEKPTEPAHRSKPLEPQAPPRPRPKATPAAPFTPGMGPMPKRSASPSPPPTADLSHYAPVGARIVVLLHTDRLRASMHRRAVEELLEVLPDAYNLLGGTGLHPIDDIDALLIATNDPRSITATFLAARYADAERVRVAIENRTPPAWDPRVLRHLAPDLSILVQPDGATRLEGAPDGGSSSSDAQWLADLQEFDQLAPTPEAPVLLVTINDLRALLRLVTLPTPQSLALAATADAVPRITIKLQFTEAAEAERFATDWPQARERWRTQGMLFGIGGLLDGVQLSQKGPALELAGELPERECGRLLQLARALLPPPARPFDPMDAGVDQGRTLP